MFHFYNTFLSLFNISYIFFWWNNCFFNRFLFDNFIIVWLCYCICIFFPISSPSLWTTFFCKQSLQHLALYPVTVFYIFSRMTKIHTFNIFFCFWFYRILLYSYLLISNVKLNLSYISNGLLFWSVNVMIVSSNSLL